MTSRALWTTTATLAILSASFFSSPALAQKGKVLHPQTAWAVTNVDEGSDPYCAIARRFRRNVILTFAENHEGMASVALDFRDSSFDRGRQYDVVLDPGSGQERSYALNPISNKAFVVRLGNDPAFFDALNRTGHMRIELAGQSYNLNLADIDQGLNTLSNCLGNNRPASVITPQDREPQREKRHLNARLDSLEEENDRLRVELAQQQAQEEMLRPSYMVPNQAGEVEPVRAIPPEEGQLDVLVERLKQLETQNVTLKRELREQQSLVSENYEEELARLSKENLRLQELLSDNISGQKMAESLQSRVNALQLENDKLKNKEEQLSKMRVEMTLLAEENTNLHKDMQQLELMRNELRLMRLEKDSVLSESSARVSDLTQHIQEVRTANSQLEEDVARHQSAVQETSEQLNELSAENATIQAELERKANIELEALALQKEFTLLETKAKSFETEIEILRKNNEELSMEQGRMALLQADKQQYEDEVEALRQLRTALEIELKENKILNATLNKDKVTLQDMAAKTQAENEVLIAELTAKLQASQSNETALEDRLSALQAENDTLMERLAAAALDQGELAQMSAQLQMLRDENAQLIRDLESAMADRDEYQTMVEALKEENRSLMERLARSEAAYDAVEKASSALEEEKDNLIDKVANLQAAQNDLERTARTLQDENAALSESLASAQNDVEGLSAQAQHMNNVSEKLAVLEEKNAALEQEKQALSTQLANATTAQKDLRGALDQLRADNDGLSDALAASKSDNKQIAALKRDLSTMRERNKNLTDELEEQRTAYAELEKMITPMRAESVSLREELQRLNSKFQEMQSQMNMREASVSAPTPQPQSQPQESVRVAEAVAPAPVPVPVEAEKIEEPEAVPVQPVSTPVQRPVERTLERPVQRQVERVVNRELVDQETGIVVQNRTVRSGDFHNEAQNLERNMVRTIKETENGFAQSGARPMQEQELPQMAAQEIVETPEAQPPVQQAEPSAQPELEPQLQPQPAQVAETPNAAQDQENRFIAGNDFEQTVDDIETAAGSVPQVEAEPIVAAETVREEARRTTQQLLDETQNAVRASAEAVSQVPQQSATNAAPQIYVPAIRIGDVLARAGITASDTPQQIPGFSGPQVVSYQWQGASGLFGSAQQRPLQSNAQFDDYVGNYLAMTEDRCQGDFAAIPASTSGQGANRSAGFEIACIGAGVSSSASILFFSQNGTFTAVAHEAPTEQMQTAMDIRDRIMQSVSGS